MCCKRREALVLPDSQGAARGFLDTMRQMANRIAEEAAAAVLDRTNRLSEILRGELHRAIKVHVLCWAVLLFGWSAMVCGSTALMLAGWERHRLATVVGATSAFLLIAVAAAAAIGRLRKRPWEQQLR